MRRLPLILLLLCLFPSLPGRTQADTPNTKRLVEVPIADAPSYAKLALVIGIDQYELCNPLDGNCALDAKAFASLLQTKLGFTNVVLMTDDSLNPALTPTGAHIKRALQTLYGGLTPGESEVVVFYSGHGTRDTNGSSDRDYLVPKDGDPNDVPGTCIDYEALRSKIETKNPIRALIITDACRDLLGGKGLSSSKKGFGGAGKAAVADPQIAELRSCKPGETSRVAKAGFTGSVFTHYLILGLQGDPGAVAPGTNQVTFDSLSRYVKGNVHQYVAQTYNDEQTPTGLATLGTMMLARSTAALPRSLDPQANARLLALWGDASGKVSPDKASAVTTDAIQQALDSGADVNAKDQDDNSPLSLATQFSKIEVIQFLCSKGADVNEKDKDGTTDLMVAAYHGKLEAAKLLLAGGAKINAQTKNGYTALIHAVFNDHADVVRWLLEKGADASLRDTTTNRTALQMAADKKYADYNGPIN